MKSLDMMLDVSEVIRDAGKDGTGDRVSGL